MIPSSDFNPSFTITRAGHIVLRVRNLASSMSFYTEVLGLLVTDKTHETVYLRGVEESCHHSLILKETSGEPTCERIGFRVFCDEDLDKAAEYFARTGREHHFVEVPNQARTLHVSDDIGVPIELVASMPRLKRMHDQYQIIRGAGALRMDHFQLAVPDAASAAAFYTGLGFRISDYFVDKEGDTDPLGIFLYKKNNPHDIVFLTRPGPVLHHFGYIVPEASNLFRALDVSNSLGFKNVLERGPGRHGEGHSLYVYFRDPDGHRVEILPPPYQTGDIDDQPIGWHRANRHSWDQPAPKSWLYEITKFEGVEIKPCHKGHGLLSLEDFLANRPLLEGRAVWSEPLDE
jgi:catechol 2,3-dioxygenase